MILVRGRIGLGLLAQGYFVRAPAQASRIYTVAFELKQKGFGR